MAHGMNGFHPNNIPSSSSNPYSDLPNATPIYNNPSHHRLSHHQPPPQQMHPPNQPQWNGSMRQNSMSQMPMPPVPQNQSFNQPGWPNNINQIHPQQFPNGMPAMGGFNMPFFSPQMMQDSFIVPPPVEPTEEKIILQTLVESKNRRESYKDALNSLHGRNGHTASQWKDYYLDHKDRLDETISVYLNPPKAALQAIKKPSPSAYRVEPSPARSLPPKPKQQDPAQRAPLPTTGKRNTINSLTAPAPVFGDRLPPPNADIQIPDPPSRSPSPPTVVIPHRGRGNKYTPEDRDFFLKFISWRLKGDPSLTRNDLCNMLAEKAPHHTAQSWASYWSNKHDVPDKILAAAKGDDYGPEESESEEERNIVRRRPKYNELSSEEDGEEKNSQSESDDDDDDDEPIKVCPESEMGQKGEPFTNADHYITAKYTLTLPNFDTVSGKERWEPYSERYPQRSAKSWAEYYRRNEEMIRRLARKIKRQGHDLSSSSIHNQRAQPSWASKDANVLHQAKRKHSLDLDAEGEDDNERPPSRNKRGRDDEAYNVTVALPPEPTRETNMDEEYDVIVLGTGLTECILSGLLSVEGKKVLHMDRNDYYGGDSASLNLTQLYRKFRPDQAPPAELGRDRDYAVDLIPKFIIASGELTKILVHTDVTRYLEFKQIAGSFVYRDGKISKVPSTEMEAVRSPLMGLFEKRRAKKFFEFLQGWKDNDPATHQGIDLNRDSMKTVYEKFGLEPGTQDFIGHAMALYLDDDYITKPARPTYDRIILYTSSMARYGKSPYIYPLYGLGELPQSFARLSAIYGGTYMLDKQIDKIVTDSDGKFVGVTSGGETVKAKQVIGDPSYFGAGSEKESGTLRVIEVGKVVRAICLLKHPIPGTDDSDSVQLIIPQNQVGRRNDIYIAMVSSTHNVCAKDIYVAIVSTIVETNRPELEIVPGLNLLGPIHEKFVSISPLYEPTSDGKQDNIFITRSYDATSHFETVVEDVQDVWQRVTGSPLVLKKREVDVQQ
ncbi:hypothetical protein C0995_011878 [Termitomyces sp. Mi166|nr:hypothetical protein C0995_011878 [Termitomyces sp. Mi166\